MRLIHELNGLSCINLEMIQEPKQNISATRSFGKVVTEEKDISEALSFHIERATQKLRAQNSVAKIISFFFHSNPFSKTYPLFRVYRSYELPVATSDPRKLNAPVQALLKKTFRNGIRYQKCGVFLQEIHPADTMQNDLFSLPDSADSKKMLATIDQLNNRFGRNTLHFASTGFAKSWITQANLKSPCYTTKWTELLTAGL
jgi:DNA polymerase V